MKKTELMNQSDFERLSQLMADKGVKHEAFELLADLRHSERIAKQEANAITDSVVVALEGLADFEGLPVSELNYLQVIRKLKEGVMTKTEMMKKYEAETGKQSAIVKFMVGGQALEQKSYPKLGPYDYSMDYIAWLEAKATAYDRLMSGNSKMTMQEMANFKGRPVTVNADGTIDAHGAEPHLARGEFAGYSDCWANDADDYEEIPESFVEIPDVFNWTTSLTLPDGWEEK